MFTALCLAALRTAQIAEPCKEVIASTRRVWMSQEDRSLLAHSLLL